jgi:hypothetical protein
LQRFLTCALSKKSAKRSTHKKFAKNSNAHCVNTCGKFDVAVNIILNLRAEIFNSERSLYIFVRALSMVLYS